MKRVLSAFIALIICLSVAPVTTGEVHAAQEDLYTAVERQIRAYAKSIDQNDAVSAAASALAVHGMTMGGKKLVMNESNALTATIFNSELVQYALIDGCASTINAMHRLDLTGLPYVFGMCGWYGANSRYVGMTSCIGNDPSFGNWDMEISSHDMYSGPRNAYDDALEWIAGTVNLLMRIERTKRTADSATYKITYCVFDRFDFGTSSNSGFKDLISGIGALLFREFDWECRVTFELTVPYTCDHTSGAYRWTYDAANISFTSDNSGNWQRNDTTLHTYVDATGYASYGHELEQTVRLLHDKPWVLEYDISRPGSFALSPLEIPSESYPELRHFSVNSFYVTSVDRVRLTDQEAADYGVQNTHTMTYHYYGNRFIEQFAWDNAKIYTLRLENEVGARGNMIYMTILDTETGAICVDHVPLDDYYTYEEWNPPLTLKNDSSSWVSGKNIYINYIGNEWSRFSTKHFELRIWENGKDSDGESYVETNVVDPTCTAEGYTVHACRACGYSYKTDYVEKLPHDYRDKVVAPTCTAEGYTEYKCRNCGDTYRTDTTEKLPHSCGEYISNNDATCAHDGTKTGKCTACGEKVMVTDEGTALPHTWTDATCVTAKTCKYCGAVEGEALGHDLKFYNAKAPACENVGWDAYEKCLRCTYSTFARLPALGHDYVNGVCTQCGDWDGTVTPGDTSGDGRVDTVDTYQIILYLNGALELPDPQLLAADVNGDGRVDLTDVYRILLIYKENG